MYFSRKAVTEYPYFGVFYTMYEPYPEDGDFLGVTSEDGNILGSTQYGLTDGTSNPEKDKVDGETILLETMCDIQQAAKMFNGGTIMADYDVYFPMQSNGILPITLGDMFRCEAEEYGIRIIGRVVGIEISQLGGVMATIKMSEV